MSRTFNMVGGAGGGIKLASIAITHGPNKTSYRPGQTFDPAGMTVEATYSNGAKATATGWTYDPSGPLTEGTESVTILYTEGGVTAQAQQAVTVQKASIAVPTQSGSLTYNGNAQSPHLVRIRPGGNDPGRRHHRHQRRPLQRRVHAEGHGGHAVAGRDDGTEDRRLVHRQGGGQREPEPAESDPGHGQPHQDHHRHQGGNRRHQRPEQRTGRGERAGQRDHHHRDRSGERQRHRDGERGGGQQLQRRLPGPVRGGGELQPDLRCGVGRHQYQRMEPDGRSGAVHEPPARP